MTSKERMLCIINHEKPDRVPCGEIASDYSVTDPVIGKETLYRGKWRELNALWDGRRDAIARDYGEDMVVMAERLGWDYFAVQLCPARSAHYSRPEFSGPYEWKDVRGRVWKFSPESEGHPLITKYAPIDKDALLQVSPIDDSRFEPIERAVARAGKTHYVVARMPETTFPWEGTMGMEAYLMMMLDEPEYIDALLDAYVTRGVRAIRTFSQIGVDAVSDGDDYCDNRGPITGYPLFQRFTLPALRRIVEAAHTEGLHFVKHSDGKQWEILPDYIAIGVDAWQGIQPRIGMDLKDLHARFAGQIALFGGVSCETLIEGTPDDVRSEVRYAIEHAGREGGLAVSCSNTLMVGCRHENVMAMYDEVRRAGVLS